MIREIKTEDIPYISRWIDEDRFQNTCLYIDSLVYGFNGKDVSTYILEEDEKTAGIIYFYHDTAHMFQMIQGRAVDPAEIVDFIENKKAKMIFGNACLINSIYPYIRSDCTKKDGYVLKYTGLTEQMPEGCVFAEEDDFEAIAKFIIDNSELGHGQTIEHLQEILLNRFKYDNCKNLCIKENDEIVSHFASYAVSEEVAFLSGMVTRADKRDRGYGSKVAQALSGYYMSEGKTTVLHCYKDNLLSWYGKMGYTPINNIVQIEIH